jgi:hypothetical protein
MKAHDSGRWRTTNAGLNQFVSAIFPQTARGYVELEALQSKTRRFIPLDDRDAIAQFTLLHERETVGFGPATRQTPGDYATVYNLKELWVIFTDIWFRETTPPSIMIRSSP